MTHRHPAPDHSTRSAPAALWLPQSTCGPDCLLDDRAGTVSRPGQAGRLIALIGVLAVLAVLLPVLPLIGADRRSRLVRTGARAVLRALGIRAVRRGVLPTRRALIVANHVSWLDIVAVLAVHRVRLVAKTEVGGWPVIGGIARRAGTIFLDRTRPRALPAVVAGATAALADGDVLAVFPEGTTSCGRDTGRFRPAFFQAAVDAGAAVVPVTLRFEVAGERTSAPAFIGDETLLVSLRRVLALRGLTIQLRAGTAIHPDPATRQAGAGRVAARRLLARMAGAAMGTAGTATAPRPGSTRAPRPMPAQPVPVAATGPMWPTRTGPTRTGPAGDARASHPELSQAA